MSIARCFGFSVFAACFRGLHSFWRTGPTRPNFPAPYQLAFRCYTSTLALFDSGSSTEMHVACCIVRRVLVSFVNVSAVWNIIE